MFQIESIAVARPTNEQDMWGSWLMSVAQALPADSWRQFQRETFEISMRYQCSPQRSHNCSPQRSHKCSNKCSLCSSLSLSYPCWGVQGYRNLHFSW